MGLPGIPALAEPLGVSKWFWHACLVMGPDPELKRV